MGHLLSFYSLTSRKAKILKQWKKKPWRYYHFNISTINYSHMMYDSWDMECDRHSFLSFCAIFCPFTLLTTQKFNILKKWKKHLEISSFCTSLPKMMIICNIVPGIWCVTDLVFIFHFGLLFPFTPLTAQKIKIFKKWKKHLDISFYTCVLKIIITWCMVAEIRCATDGWTEVQTDRESDI